MRRLGRFGAEDTHWHPVNMIYGNTPGKTTAPNIFAIRQSGNLYVYCMNNSISFYDPNGLVAGDLFDSYEDALKDMYKEYYCITKYTQFELGAALYKTGDNYSYTEPFTGSPDSVPAGNAKSDIPSDGRFVATIHTHPNGNAFSRGDAIYVNSTGNVLFVLTPKGEVRYLDKVTAANVSAFDRQDGDSVLKGALIAKKLKTRELEAAEKEALMKEYGPLMEKHLDGECTSGWHKGWFRKTSQAYIDCYCNTFLNNFIQLEKG